MTLWRRLRAGFTVPPAMMLPAYVLAVVALAASLATAGWSETWQKVGVVPLKPVFADMRTVQGAIDSLARGLDPHLSNPSDPWKRTLNYPRVWVDIGNFLGIADETRYLAMCALIIAAFVACCAMLLHRYPSLPLLVALLSNAVLLGIERGNNDLLIFVALAGFALTMSSGFGLAFLSAAAVLKIYPVLAAAALGIRGQMRLLLVSLAVAVAGVALFHREILALGHATPISINMSYGLPSTFKLIGPDPVARATFLVAVGVLIVAAARLGCRVPTVCTEREGQAYQLFLVGACIYVGTYLLASNWDYRTMFLALCVPYLFAGGGGSAQLLIGLMLLVMNMQWLHDFKLAAAFAVTDFLDLDDFMWVRLYRIPWFTLDHGLKAILFAALAGMLAGHWHERVSGRVVPLPLRPETAA